MTDLEIEQFWRWFQQHASALASDDDAAVADKLHAALIAIDEAIAVEVATVDNQVREVIISGSGEPAAMQKVKAVVNASPVTHAWRFIALKPPRGFDFKLDYGGTELDASRLHFGSMVSASNPGLLGIMIYCPDRLLRSKRIRDVMWRIVETGLGEEMAQSIAAIRLDPIPLAPTTPCGFISCLTLLRGIDADTAHEDAGLAPRRRDVAQNGRVSCWRE
jgi:hypothetical protein